MELLQMYAVQAEAPNTGAWLPDIWVLSGGDSKAEQLLHRLAFVQQRSQLLYPTILKRAEQNHSKKAQFSAIPKAWPLKGIFTSAFGYRINPISGRRKFHAGIDIAAPSHTKIYAPANGEVIWAGRKGGYGKTLEIDHSHGVITRYAHNSKILVKSGQQVKKGDIIAKVGTTGDSTGPHLHYEIRVDGISVDPIKYIIE
jgi:murein DD-endopeptidase MepM/ murein hydrolase activator NlpD